MREGSSGSVPPSPTISKVAASPVSPAISVSSSPTISKVAASPASTSGSVPPSPIISKVAASPVSPAISVSSPTTPATAVQHQLISIVQEAWAGKDVYVLLSRIGPYKIFFKDINKTAPNNELESEVINAYMRLLVRRFNTQSKEQAFQIDSFEMTNIWNGNKSKLKVNPTLYKYLIGIVNDHHHWTLVVMLPSQRRALFRDPLGESSAKQKRCQDMTRAFMRQKGCNFSRWSCDTLPHPKQQDGTSCGVFALKFAEFVLSEEPIVFLNTPEEVEELRKAIAVTLLQNSDDLSNLCHVCGEESGDTDWGSSCL
ncbi:sentrin-specific protease 2-like [Siphateles boraxobius]|uniref:sentrin-specific protease 2-like n=1 Tax=Siphateles boraxobius TaxID=180520 RepID=UPI004062AAC4